MPLFLDSHVLAPGVTLDEVAAAHARDLEIQGRHGVRYLKYWYDPVRGRVFCLVLAPSREAALTVHEESGGEQPDDIFEVQEFE